MKQRPDSDEESNDAERFWRESAADRENLHRIFEQASRENSEAHTTLHKKIDALTVKVDEMIVMLKIGKAGIAFIKFISAFGAAVAVIFTAIVELGRHK